jgi:uncharacterized protein (UPF0297 family)
MSKPSLSETQKVNVHDRPEQNEARGILADVYDALKEKGYNPGTQIVGYLISGEPTDITSHKNARTVIGRLERDELLEEIVREYLGEK